MVKARFYDIDTLLTIENQAWVVNKDQPNVPLYKIEKSDFNLIKSGIYRKQNNKIDFNGRTFWLPTQLVNELKVKAKSYKTDFSNLAISMQEFLNKDIIDHLDYSLNEGLIDDLKNSSDDVYIICNRQSKRNYESLLQKLEEQLKEVGVSIKAFYYISENFYNQNDDEFKFKKMRLLLQHLVGYKTDGDKFIDEEVTRYNSIRYYDNNYDTLKFADDINPLFEIILSKTDNGVREVIKEDVKEYRPSLMINKVNDNLYNRLEEKKVIINLSNIVMTFESFRKLN